MKSFEIMEALTDLSDEVVLLTEADTQSIKSKRSKSGGVRWLKWTAAAVAAIMLTTVSAYAVDAVFNDGAIAARISEKLNDGGFPENDGPSDKIKETKPTISRPQQDAPDDQEQKPAESFTSNGVTVTPISAISDGRVCYVHIRLEAPKDMVLEDLPKSREYALTGAVRVHDGGIVRDAEVTTLPDEDPTDNVKEFILELHSDWMFGFIGQKLRITIPGLCVRGVPGTTEKTYENKLFDLKLRIELPVTHITKSYEEIELKNMQNSHYIEKYDFTVNLESITITPFRIEIHYTATLPEDENVLPDGGYAQIVMKDGTRLTFGDQSNISDGPDVGYQLLSKFCQWNGLDFNNYYGRVARECYLDDTINFGFKEELALEEIDYIVWCGGQIIDVN